VDIDSMLSMRKPELQVNIDRERAMDLGIPVQMIANTLSVLVGGQIVSSFKEGTEQYDVWLRADKQFRTDSNDLLTLSIPSPSVGQVQLSSLAETQEKQGPSQIDRLNRQRTVLAALPVTFPFGLLSLLLFRTPLDLYAMFGLFMLIGIVKKNGILQVDKTNELRRSGMPREAAILEANHTRLRPILMTTVMLMAAMVPIALGQGPGASARASMAKVIIGGQALSLLISLLATPVAYSLLDDFRIFLARKWSQAFGQRKAIPRQWRARAIGNGLPDLKS